MSVPNPNAGGSRGSSTGGGAFVEVYVQEVLINPGKYVFPDDDNENPENYLLKGSSITEDELKKAPYNSIVGRIVSSNEENTEIILYPMMQGHMALPVKAGEHVWAMQNNGRYYWLCRKNFDVLIDDVNITWGGRFKSSTTGRKTSEASNAAEGSGGFAVPSNQNPKLNSIFPAEATEPGQESFETFWSERTKSVLEPVPRYKKRPGDLVLQGSNNTLICLGLGGGHKREDELKLDTDSIAETMVDTTNGPRGSIDIVTGRGRYLPAQSTNAQEKGVTAQRTACETIVAEFGYTEALKNPGVAEIPPEEVNNVEGDPDFGFDASRIYISTTSDVDKEFTLIPNYPKIPAVITASEGNFPESSIGSAVVLKSDHVRIVARNHKGSDHFKSDPATNHEDVNGNIRLVKEGTRDDNGHSTTDGLGASIVSLESDGTVMIDGASIVIGTGREEDNGSGNQVFIGAGATEPLILGNIMHDLLEKFFKALKKWLSEKYDHHVHFTGTGTSTPPTVRLDDAGTQDALNELKSTLSKIGMTK